MNNPRTRATNCLVLDESGTYVGDIVRQRGSTLWSLQRRGMDRPFKRDIPTLDAAKALAAEYPQVWGGTNFKLGQALKFYAFWVTLLATFTVAVHFAAVD